MGRRATTKLVLSRVSQAVSTPSVTRMLSGALGLAYGALRNDSSLAAAPRQNPPHWRGLGALLLSLFTCPDMRQACAGMCCLSAVPIRASLQRQSVSFGGSLSGQGPSSLHAASETLPSTGHLDGPPSPLNPLEPAPHSPPLTPVTEEKNILAPQVPGNRCQGSKKSSGCRCCE